MENKYVVFQLKSQLYGINVDYIKEVCEYSKPVPVPRSIQTQEGVLNLRGNIIPIINLNKKLNIDNPNPPEKIIITGSLDNTIGLTVDRTIGIRFINSSSIKHTNKNHESHKHQHIKGMAIIDEQIVMIINEEILTSVLKRGTKC